MLYNGSVADKTTGYPVVKTATPFVTPALAAIMLKGNIAMDMVICLDFMGIVLVVIRNPRMTTPEICKIVRRSWSVCKIGRCADLTAITGREA